MAIQNWTCTAFCLQIVMQEQFHILYKMGPTFPQNLKENASDRKIILKWISLR
jgi:hypothetical protein